jgi:FYVE/RhoGEF/PH domain-containing protein 1
VIGVGAGLTPYRVRARFNVSQVEVLEGDNLETANTFYLREAAKTVELYTGTAEEKEAWIDSLFAAMTELTRRKSSLRISPVQQQQSNKGSRTPSFCSQEFGDGLLGKTAPTLVRVDSVTRCFQCQGQFSVMRRKHHCHSCGKVLNLHIMEEKKNAIHWTNFSFHCVFQVACNRCSSHKLALPYDGTKALRVCDACHQSLTCFANQQSNTISHNANSQIPDSPASSPELTPSPPSLRTGLLEVNVETPSVMAGYLSLKTRGKTWQRRWFALRSDFVLYSYRSDQGEDRAVTATPVPGFSVSLISGSSSLLSDGSSPSQMHLPIGKTNSISSTNGTVLIASDNNGMISERDRSFKMAHVHKSYHFQAATRQEAEK